MCTSHASGCRRDSGTNNTACTAVTIPLPCACHILQAAHARMAWRCLCISDHIETCSRRQEASHPAAPFVCKHFMTTPTGQPNFKATSPDTCSLVGPCCCSSSRAFHSLHTQHTHTRAIDSMFSPHKVGAESSHLNNLSTTCTAVRYCTCTSAAPRHCLGIPAAARRQSLCQTQAASLQDSQPSKYAQAAVRAAIC